MLTYNLLRKYNLERSDPVREILAKIDAKQSKTGLSLYNQGCPAVSLPGVSPHNEEKTLFPDPKAARKKAHNRITTDSSRFESSQWQTQTKRPTKLPSNKVGNADNPTFPPSLFSNDLKCDGYIVDQQLENNKIDININPFGYNRKTLAYQTRNINYVVQWPETWPFKITSFQKKKKSPLKDIKRRNQANAVNQAKTLDNKPQDPSERTEYSPHTRARVLAPIDNPPTKQQAMSSKPYVESSVIKRDVRKYTSKEEGKQFILRSQGKDEGNQPLTRTEINLNSKAGEPRNDSSTAGEFGTQSLTSSPNAKFIQPEISKERVDSVPPSTPVPKEPDPAEACSESLEDPSEDVGGPSQNVRDRHEDKDPKSLLTDIVNQIVEESTPLTI